jgi:hypothetical protein
MAATQIARNHLIDFSVAIDENYQDTWFHESIASVLELALEKIERGEDARIILEIPPQCGKSYLATQLFPAWVLGKHPDWPIMVGSYSADLAVQFGQQTRDIMRSPAYSMIFSTRLRQDTKAKGHWMTQQGGSYIAAGAGGVFTGRGFKIGIVDDLFKNREEAESEVIRESRWQWWLSTFYTRQRGNTAIIVPGTRWHTDDIIGRITEKEKKDRGEGAKNYDKWTIIKFPAIATEDEPFRKKGEALWPERFPLSKLETIKNTLGPYNFLSLYQQEPITSETQEFKENWIIKRKWEEVVAKDTRKFATIDPGGKEAENDYTGIVRNYVDNENKWNFRAMGVHFDSKELINYIFTLHDEGFEKIGIEETVYLKAIEPFFKEECRKRNKFPTIVPLRHNKTQKEVRIRGLIPRYSSGSIFHIEGECADLEKELLVFPKGAHDDVCFAGGTKVATIFGDKPIEKIKAGESVITPTGIKRVLFSGCTGKKEVIYNIGLRGTPSHKIFTFDGGLTTLDSISYHNHISKLTIKELLLWRYKKLLLSMGGNIGLWGRESIILSSRKTIKNGKVLRDFMWRFGRLITKRKFRKAFAFTIKTATLLITTLAIWSVYLMANIIKYQLELIKKKGLNIWQRFVRLPSNGINQRKGENGIKNIGKGVLAKLNRQSMFVSIAVKNFLAKTATQNFAAVTINVPLGESLSGRESQGCASFAEEILMSGRAQQIKHAQLLAGQGWATKQENVYNLKVEEDGMYYANNILVSNCDAAAAQNEIAEAPISERERAILEYQREERKSQVAKNFGL